jgi:hypothetical protein
MAGAGNSLSRNPNICASCSSLSDGMDAASDSEPVAHSPEASTRETTAPAKALPREQIAVSRSYGR